MAEPSVSQDLSAHRRPRSRSVPILVAALATGVVAVAVGAGLGIRRLQLEGATVLAVVGLALLVVGLGLVVVSARLLWRSVRGWRRLWFVPAVALSVVAAWSLMFAVMVTVVPATPLGRSDRDSAGVAYRTVTVVTDDGVTLSAWWAPSSNGAAVVLMHGSGENRSATLPAAAVLARHGYGVLLLDARGHGDSEGPGMDLGWYGDADIGAGLGFLAEQGSVDPSRMAVLGLSMGGEEAVGAAAAYPQIRAVVAEGVTSRTAEDKAAWLPNGVDGAIQRVIDRLTYGVVDALTPAGPPAPLRESVAGARGARMLLIAAGTSPDEQAAADVLRSAAPDRVGVWTVPGGTHTSGLTTAPAEWESRVVAFLDSALAPA